MTNWKLRSIYYIPIMFALMLSMSLAIFDYKISMWFVIVLFITFPITFVLLLIDPLNTESDEVLPS